jgi:hypothetical protein
MNASADEEHYISTDHQRRSGSIQLTVLMILIATHDEHSARWERIGRPATRFWQKRSSAGTTAGGDADPFQAGGYFREMSSIRASAARL